MSARAPFATGQNDAPPSPRSGRARGTSAAFVSSGSGIFGGSSDSAPVHRPGRGSGQAHSGGSAPFAATVSAYQETAPRPRIVNGKIVRGEALLSAPAATGAPSPSTATGLTWAPSPPVIRRRAADEAAQGAAAAYSQQPQYAEEPPRQQQQQQQQQAYPSEEEAYGYQQQQQQQQQQQYQGSGGGYVGAYAEAEERQQYAAQQQQQYQQQQQRPSTSPQLPGRGTGITHSSNRFASGANQNAGNVLTDRPTSRVLAPPGGRSSISIG